jgi:hypothetical protein
MPFKHILNAIYKMDIQNIFQKKLLPIALMLSTTTSLFAQKVVFYDLYVKDTLKSQHNFQAHLKTAQANPQTKVFKRACKAFPKEKLNKKNSNALKKIKNTPSTADTQ